MILYGIDNIRDLFGHKVLYFTPKFHAFKAVCIIFIYEVCTQSQCFCHFAGRSCSYQEEPDM